MLIDVSAAFLVILGILNAVQLVARAIPIGRVSLVVVNRAIANVEQLIVRINVQRAANDNTFRRVIEETLRRAA